MTKPSELDPYVLGQDYNFHGHRPGESVRISVDDLAPTDGRVQSKRDLEAIGQYYKADGRMISNANDPELGALYALTDPLGVQSPSIIPTYEGKAVKVARGFQTMALNPFDNDIYYVDTLDRLCKLTEASSYTSAVLVETGISGIAFTVNRTFKCLSSTGNCVVINNSDQSERTILASLAPAFAGAYSLGDGFDYVTVGDKIWAVDDNSITEYARASNLVYMFAKAADRLFYVPKNDESGIFEITDTVNYFQYLNGVNSISTLSSVADTIIALQPSGTGSTATISTFNVVENSSFSTEIYEYDVEYLIPLTETAFIITFANDSGRTYHSLYTQSRGLETEYDLQVDPAGSDPGAQFVRIGDSIFVNGGTDINGNGYMFRAMLQPADPTLMQLPNIGSFDGFTFTYLRRG